MKNILLHCRSGKLGSLFLVRFLTDLWYWVIPLVSSTWMLEWSAVVSVLAAWGRMILIFYQEIYVSQVAYSSSILTASIVLPHVPPHQTWQTVSAVFWNRLTCFICSHVVSFLLCLFGAHRATVLELDEKSSSGRGRNYCLCSSARLKREEILFVELPVSCSSCKGYQQPEPWHFPCIFLSMDAEYSHSIPWVMWPLTQYLSGFATKK